MAGTALGSLASGHLLGRFHPAEPLLPPPGSAFPFTSLGLGWGWGVLLAVFAFILKRSLMREL